METLESMTRKMRIITWNRVNLQRQLNLHLWLNSIQVPNSEEEKHDDCDANTNEEFYVKKNEPKKSEIIFQDEMDAYSSLVLTLNQSLKSLLACKDIYQLIIEYALNCFLKIKKNQDFVSNTLYSTQGLIVHGTLNEKMHTCKYFFTQHISGIWNDTKRIYILLEVNAQYLHGQQYKLFYFDHLSRVVRIKHLQGGFEKGICMTIFKSKFYYIATYQRALVCFSPDDNRNHCYAFEDGGVYGFDSFRLVSSEDTLYLIRIGNNKNDIGKTMDIIKLTENHLYRKSFKLKIEISSELLGSISLPVFCKDIQACTYVKPNIYCFLVLEIQIFDCSKKEFLRRIFYEDQIGFPGERLFENKENQILRLPSDPYIIYFPLWKCNCKEPLLYCNSYNVKTRILTLCPGSKTTTTTTTTNNTAARLFDVFAD